MFAYCLNNPANMEDQGGEFAWFLPAIFVAIKAVVTVVAIVAAVLTTVAVVNTVHKVVNKVSRTITAGTISYASKKVTSKAKKKNNSGKQKEDRAPDRSSRLQEEVKRGQAPREVERVDDCHDNILNSKPHVHFKDGTSMNNDGSIHDEHHGTPNPSNKTKKWLQQHGWKTS